MEKEPVRVFTPFQWDGTKKHWEPQREREYHLKNLCVCVEGVGVVCVWGGVCV